MLVLASFFLCLLADPTVVLTGATQCPSSVMQDAVGEIEDASSFFLQMNAARKGQDVQPDSQSQDPFEDARSRRQIPPMPFPFPPFGPIGGSNSSDPPSSLQEIMNATGQFPPGFGFPGAGGGVNLATYKNATGLATLYTDPGNSMDLILDITDMLKGSGLIMVTALAAEGTYSDQRGTVLPLHSPMEETRTTIFKLAQSKDNKSIDVFQPQLTMRTSDSETQTAWDKGVDSPWIGKLKLMQTSAPQDRIVVDGIELIQRGFFVSPSLGSAIQSYHLTRVKSYPNNFDVSLTFLTQFGQISVTFSVIRPPSEPMTSRVYDDRLPYFTQDYQDLGVHTKKYDNMFIDPRKKVDPDVSVIWKYDLQRLPSKQIRIHVDPSVPERWHNSFKRGIEAWNDAFMLAGYSNDTIRGVLPSDSDWPKDYDAGDARFNTISWAIDSSQVFSMGIAKVDPRSGEILKSDIIMGAGWVRSWLNDLHTMKLSESQDLDSGYFQERVEKNGTGRISWPGVSDAAVGRASAAFLQADADVKGVADADSDSKKKVDAANEAAAINLLGERPISLMAMGLPKESWFEVVEAGLKAVVMHEAGHILGLRHNFKGSLGVSYECTQNMSCSAEQGLTASIMDYIPMNIPSAGVENVHLFSPVVGAYDKLAIRYGYMELPKESKEVVNGMPVTPPFLERILDEANQFQNCVDGDRISGEDPLCAAYDFTAEPLRYYEDQMKLLQKVQQKLLDISVGPGEPYWQFGDMVWSTLVKVFKMQETLVDWIGGMNVTYVHRPITPSMIDAQTAVRSISSSDQRKALNLLFDLSRPGKNGLLPTSDLLRKLAYKSQDGISYMNLKSSIRNQQEYLLTKLLNVSTLKHIESSKDFGGLSIDTFLNDTLYQIMGSQEGTDFEKTVPQDWDMQMFLVENLGRTQPVPESIEPHILMATKSALRAVESGLKTLDAEAEAEDTADWSSCDTQGSQTCVCYGQVRIWLGDDWSSPVDSPGSVECRSKSFDLKSDVPDAVCQCLPRNSAKAALRTHLLEMRGKLKKAATNNGLSLESGASKHSLAWPFLLILAVAIGRK